MLMIDGPAVKRNPLAGAAACHHDLQVPVKDTTRTAKLETPCFEINVLLSAWVESPRVLACTPSPTHFLHVSWGEVST
jgi:hypothetical protein